MRGWKLLPLLVLSLALAARSYAAPEPIKLRAANYLPPTHKMSLLTAWFCDEVKKRTNGRVEINYSPGGTLLSPVKMYQGVVQGIADLGFSHTAYTRGRFPVTETLDLPLGFTSGYVATEVSNDFYNKFKPKEWDDVHALYFATSGPLVIHTIAKPVRTLEDLKGLKIRATGQMADTIKVLGATPVPLEMPDVYESLRKGVIDGVAVDLSTLKYWKFAEVVKNVTASWQVGSGYTFYFVINKAKWNALPPDVQKVFTEVAAEAKDKQARLWNEMDIEGKEALKAAGGQLINLAQAEGDRWDKAADPVIVQYKKDMVAKGNKPEEVDSWIKFVRERIAFWTKEEARKTIPSPYK
ncbi:MAG: TRAP transporter substrate-binding protein [Deltaproteobacteria bacterium]|nr:TRAP transporter substrate-binding protein [Deltaproteobacteria bacterium]